MTKLIQLIKSNRLAIKEKSLYCIKLLFYEPFNYKLAIHFRVSNNFAFSTVAKD